MTGQLSGPIFRVVRIDQLLSSQFIDEGESFDLLEKMSSYVTSALGFDATSGVRSLPICVRAFREVRLRMRRDASNLLVTLGRFAGNFAPNAPLHSKCMQGVALPPTVEVELYDDDVGDAAAGATAAPPSRSLYLKSFVNK